jgi:aminopeptidase 2
MMRLSYRGTRLTSCGPSGWDNLYLNEGFATWAGDFALHKVLPEYRMDTHFVGNVLEMALSLDAKQSTHAVEVNIPDESRIIQVFDAVSYQKAASGAFMCMRLLS